MTNIELKLAESTHRLNNVLVRHFEDIDWEQRRYEIAKTVMPQCIITCNEVLKLGGKLNHRTLGEQVTSMAVMYADLLINELKKNV